MTDIYTINHRDAIVAQLNRQLDEATGRRAYPRLVWVNPNWELDDTAPSECNPDDGDAA